MNVAFLTRKKKAICRELSSLPSADPPQATQRLCRQVRQDHEHDLNRDEQRVLIPTPTHGTSVTLVRSVEPKLFSGSLRRRERQPNFPAPAVPDRGRHQEVVDLRQARSDINRGHLLRNAVNGSNLLRR